MTGKTIILGITGASGVRYGLRLLECLLETGQKVFLMLSAPAQVVIAHETELKLPGQSDEIRDLFLRQFHSTPDQLQVCGPSQWFAPPASGSNAPDAMVVCPCTAATLSAIAAGASNNLLQRAADVVLKEQRKLILVLREMPLSAIHLENMLKLARMGTVIMPASPGFYHRPTQVEELIDFVVARILDHLGIDHQLVPRWGEPSPG